MSARQQREREAARLGGRGGGRPEPDEARLDDELTHQPERREPRPGDLTDLRRLSRRDWQAILGRAGKRSLSDTITDLSAALSYYSFLAIPSVLLVAFGLLGLIAPASTLHSLAAKLASIGPGQANQFLGGSVERLHGSPGQTITMTVVGFVLALWTTTGAMTAFTRALNRIYGVEETRSFVAQRVTAVKMVGIMCGAFALVFVLMIVGPGIAGRLGSTLGIGGWMQLIWWVAQWPILLSGLFAAFGTVLWLGPNVEHPRLRFLTPGSLVAALGWVVASGLFALYTANFGSYNQTWGSLSAVIVMLTWLWISGLALLFGAEVNAEAERSRGAA